MNERIEYFISLYNRNLRNFLLKKFRPEGEEIVLEWFRLMGEPVRLSLEQDHPELADKFINPFEKVGKRC